MEAEEAKNYLMNQRDMMLREVEALKNKVEGLDMAIAILGKQDDGS
jgi:hypothetical protein